MKRTYLAIMMSLTIFGTALSFASPVMAACTDQFLGINAWYKGLQDAGTCDVVMSKTGQNADIRKFVMIIALNIIQAGFAIVAYVTVFFIIKGGFMYMASAGAQEGMASAKKTITNAVIGLIIAILAASIVNAVAGAF